MKKSINSLSIAVAIFMLNGCDQESNEKINNNALQKVTENVQDGLNTEEWNITNTIPYPDQASSMVYEVIKNGGQPDVKAMKGLSFPNDQSIIDFVAKGDEGANVRAQQLAEKLGVTIKEEKIAGVVVRYITPSTIDPKHKNRLFIHTHGGAYILNSGLAGTGEAILIAHYSKIAVVSIDYRMPPIHPFPAAIDDVLSVYKKLIKNHDSKNLAIGGTSAGGGLSMASIHKFKEVGLELPGALFLGTPWSDLSKTGDSYFTNEGIDHILVSYEGLLDVAAKSYSGESDIKNPLISPVYGDFQEFPPTYLITGTRDLFLSNTVRVHRKLKNAGIVADLNVYEGLSHGEFAFVFGSPECIQSYTELGEFLDNNMK